jgi:hypothetical protein
MFKELLLVLLIAVIIGAMTVIGLEDRFSVKLLIWVGVMFCTSAIMCFGHVGKSSIQIDRWVKTLLLCVIAQFVYISLY